MEPIEVIEETNYKIEKIASNLSDENLEIVLLMQEIISDILFYFFGEKLEIEETPVDIEVLYPTNDVIEAKIPLKKFKIKN